MEAGFIIREVASSTASTATTSSSSVSERGGNVLSLGKTLVTLIEAEDAKGKRQSDTGVMQALSALSGLIKKEEKMNQSIKNICLPLLQQMSKKSQQSKVQRVFRWLFTHHTKSCCATLYQMLNDEQESKAVRMAIVYVIRAHVEGQMFYHSSGRDSSALKELVSEDPFSEEYFFSGKTTRYDLEGRWLSPYLQLLLPLLKVVERESAKDGAKRLPTRFTVAAADCILVITNALAIYSTEVVKREEQEKEQKEKEKAKEKESKEELLFAVEAKKKETAKKFLIEEIGGETSESEKDIKENITTVIDGEATIHLLWKQLDLLIALIGELKGWYREPRPLYVVALDAVFKFINSLLKYRKAAELHKQDISLAQKIFAFSWAIYPSYLTEESSNTKKAERHLSTLFESLQDPVACGKDYSPDVAVRTLTCICLVLGRLSKKELDKTMESISGKYIFGIILQQLHAPPEEETIHYLAVQLLQKALANNAETDGVDALAQSLLELMDESRDATSKAVVGFLAEYAARNPEAMLDDIFLRLDSSEKIKRHNALDILVEVFKINSKISTANKELGHRLARNLLQRLHDSELCLRAEAASLFANLEPSYIIPRLATMVYHKDARVRSAADEALIALFESHPDVCGTIVTLLDCIRTKNKQTVSPADIGKPKKGRTTGQPTEWATDFAERVLRVVPKWAAKLPEHVWPDLIKTVVERMYQMPDDTTLVKFLSKIGNFMGMYIMTLLPLVTKQMESQPKLTVDFLCEEDESTLAKTLFDRLSPLLILKVLPYKSFVIREGKPVVAAQTVETVAERKLIEEIESPPPTELDKPLVTEGASTEEQETKEAKEKKQQITALADLLFQRMAQPYEFDEIRKVAAEVASFLPPELFVSKMLKKIHTVASSLASLEELNEKTILKWKTVNVFVFYLCNSFMLHQDEMYGHIPSLAPLLLHILAHPLTRSHSEDLQKLQLGCIDCLGFMLKCTFSQSREGMRKYFSEIAAKRFVLPNEAENEDLWGAKTLLDLKMLSGKDLLILLVRYICMGVGEDQDEDLDGKGKALKQKAKIVELLMEDDQGKGKGKEKEKEKEKETEGGMKKVKMNMVEDNEKFIGRTGVSPGFRICIINTLISVCKSMELADLILLAQGVLEPIIFSYFHRCSSKVPGEQFIRAAHLQLLFTMAFYLKADVSPYSTDLLSTALHALKDESSDVQLAGMKLLGGLMGTVDDLFEKAGGMPMIFQTQMLLGHISQSSPSQPARELAEKLLSAFMAGN